MSETREPRQVFWTLVFIALTAIIIYVGSFLFVKESMLPMLGIIGAATGLSLWGTIRQYQKRHWFTMCFGAVVTLGCLYFALITCVEIGDIFHIVE